MKKGFTKTRHSDEQSEEESNKLDRSFACAQDDRLREGFTLVELSIVLVIIGLLISGLLVGQSMIKAAKIGAQIKQFSQFEIAIRNFKTKYGKLPGDSPYHSAAGDGDGTVETAAMNGGSTSSWATYDYELANFWGHLQQDDFLSNEYPTFSTDASSGVRAGVHFPKAKLGGGQTGVALYISTDSSYIVNPSHRFYLADFEASTNGNIAAGTAGSVASIPVAEMLALDAKLDDGVAYVSNWTLYYAGEMNTSTASSSCYTVSGTHYPYNVSGGDDCYLHFVWKNVRKNM